MSILPQSVDPQIKILTLMAHAAMGRRLLPTVWIADDGRCSCMERPENRDRPSGEVCSRAKPGKHPRISQWQVRATNDQDKILEWHHWVPRANWGWLQEDTFTLDVDPKRGGLESLAQWEEEMGGPVPTFTQATPSGGWHLVYRQPTSDVDQRVHVSGDVLPGIEIRGLGSYIMVDPSVGVGGSWTIQDPNVEPAEPDELTLRLIARHGIDPTGYGDGVETLGGGGGSRGRRRTKSSGMSDLPATDWFLQSGFGGHTGSRNVDAYRLAWRLLALGDRYPEVYTTNAIADIMRRCWRATEQGDSPFEWSECLGALRSAWKRRERQKSEEYARQFAIARTLLAQPSLRGGVR